VITQGYLKVSACLKHYAAYSLEGDCPGPSCRESFPAVVTALDMEDTYLPAFQAGVEKGLASGSESSPSCHNQDLPVLF